MGAGRCARRRGGGRDERSAAGGSVGAADGPELVGAFRQPAGFLVSAYRELRSALASRGAPRCEDGDAKLGQAAARGGRAARRGLKDVAVGSVGRGAGDQVGRRSRAGGRNDLVVDRGGARIGARAEALARWATIRSGAAVGWTMARRNSRISLGERRIEGTAGAGGSIAAGAFWTAGDVAGTGGAFSAREAGLARGATPTAGGGLGFLGPVARKKCSNKVSRIT